MGVQLVGLCHVALQLHQTADQVAGQERRAGTDGVDGQTNTKAANTKEASGTCCVQTMMLYPIMLTYACTDRARNRACQAHGGNCLKTPESIEWTTCVGLSELTDHGMYSPASDDFVQLNAFSQHSYWHAQEAILPACLHVNAGGWAGRCTSERAGRQ